MTKPILCLDFDGVIHSYTSGWMGPTEIQDPPVPGAMEFLVKAYEVFNINIYSSRSGTDEGIAAMKFWLAKHMADHFSVFGNTGIHPVEQAEIFAFAKTYWPTKKPPAMVTIDDRAITFTGTWPDIGDLLAFQPWNKGDRQSGT